jgi:hypothetical protein
MTEQRGNIERLLAFVAGELDAKGARDMRNLIAADPELAQLERLARLVRQTLQEDDSVEPPPQVVARAKELFRQLHQAPAPSPSLRERVHAWLEAADRIVALLVFDSRARPALAGYRGTAELVRLSYESDLAEIDLELTPREDGGAVRVSVYGQITATDEPAGAPVILTTAGTHDARAQTVCDSGGLFEITLERGRYDLHVRLPSGVVSALEIDL